MEGEYVVMAATQSITAIGVIYSIWKGVRNGRKKDNEVRDELKNTVKLVVSRLDDPDTGVRAIKDAVEETRDEAQKQKEFCIKHSTQVTEHLKVHDRELEELKKRKR